MEIIHGNIKFIEIFLIRNLLWTDNKTGEHD